MRCVGETPFESTQPTTTQVTSVGEAETRARTSAKVSTHPGTPIPLAPSSILALPTRSVRQPTIIYASTMVESPPIGKKNPPDDMQFPAMCRWTYENSDT